MFCRQQVAEFRPHVDEVKQAGLELAIIGSGTPHFAKAFLEDLKLGDLPVYCDQELKSFAAAELRRSWGTVLDPRALAKGLVAMKYKQKKTMGDATQQGGVLIVRPDGTIPYHFVSRFAGDHAKNATILAEVKKAAA